MQEKGIVRSSFEAPRCMYVISQTRFSFESHRILLRMSRSVKELSPMLLGVERPLNRLRLNGIRAIKKTT